MGTVIQKTKGKKAYYSGNNFEIKLCKKMNWKYIKGNKDKADAININTNVGYSIKKMSSSSTGVLTTTRKSLNKYVPKKYHSLFYSISEKEKISKRNVSILNNDRKTLRTVLRFVLMGYYKKNIIAKRMTIYNNEEKLICEFSIHKMINDFLDYGVLEISPQSSCLVFRVFGKRILHLQRKGSGPEITRNSLLFHVYSHPSMKDIWV